MADCYLSNRGAYYMGKLVNHNIGTGHNWFSCNNGWYCSFVSILLNHALVENTVAKLKYVSSTFS